MKEIPLKAKVNCSDGPCGESTNIIIDRDTLQVTHVAIKNKKLPGNPTRLVPIEKVADALHDKIALNITFDEVARMDPFIVSQEFQDKESDTGYDTVPVGEIPVGQVAIDPGMKIYASDKTTVGHLDEFLLDPRNGAITHILMIKGHLWGKKDVAIPLDNVARADVETIYLNIDKDAVEALPAVSTKRS